jgi:hypothetical protein
MRRPPWGQGRATVHLWFWEIPELEAPGQGHTDKLCRLTATGND